MSEPTKEWKELSIEEKFDQLNEGIINTRNQFGESIFHIKKRYDIKRLKMSLYPNIYLIVMSNQPQK